jgi:hypothetical protein
MGFLIILAVAAVLAIALNRWEKGSNVSGQA